MIAHRRPNHCTRRCRPLFKYIFIAIREQLLPATKLSLPYCAAPFGSGTRGPSPDCVDVLCLFAIKCDLLTKWLCCDCSLAVLSTGVVASSRIHALQRSIIQFDCKKSSKFDQKAESKIQPPFCLVFSLCQKEQEDKLLTLHIESKVDLMISYKQILTLM